ncbi:hypothetical protein KEM48_002294 [Puccinia striiformis f. sp. tritici PST-130]|nr:hypothetical protein KEM48_002294 [Puccinia striiformis f. sp. tritici PST-130]
MATMCHALLVVHHISHWGFFCGMMVAQVVGLGFQMGPPTQIYNGALQLEKTMRNRLISTIQMNNFSKSSLRDLVASSKLSDLLFTYLKDQTGLAS